MAVAADPPKSYLVPSFACSTESSQDNEPHRWVQRYLEMVLKMPIAGVIGTPTCGAASLYSGIPIPEVSLLG